MSRRIPGEGVETVDTNEQQQAAVGTLQELGLKEYEADCYVGLTRMESATAKELSEATEVPRTRVYDAIHVLEIRGLVEIQHSSPQRYRAVPLDEAVETLRDQFESRVERLRESVGRLEPVDSEGEPISQEVWALSGRDAIANRTQQLMSEATEEIVFVIGEESIVTDELIDELNDISEEITLIIGTLSKGLEDRIESEVPHSEVFVSGLEWLHGHNADDETAIGRMVLIDRQTILMSSYDPETGNELAVFGSGFGNGLVVIIRRLMETGLLPVDTQRVF